MNQDYIIEIAQRMLVLVAVVAGPMLLGGMVAGLIVAVFQAATQIQESSLTFIPKVVVLGLGLLIGGPWALEQLVTFTSSMFVELVNIAPHQVIR